MSWKPEVVADSSRQWVGNALRFATREEAEAQVRDLARRWFSVTDTRVVESTDPVNYTYIDGKLEAIPEHEQDAVDIKVRCEGTIYIVDPVSEAGETWIAQHIPEDAIRWGEKGVVIERRKIEDIVASAVEAGLEVG